ncbi:MAG: hypothetical protein ACOC04_01250 [Halothece sp.]
MINKDYIYQIFDQAGLSISSEGILATHSDGSPRASLSIEAHESVIRITVSSHTPESTPLFSPASMEIYWDIYLDEEGAEVKEKTPKNWREDIVSFAKSFMSERVSVQYLSNHGLRSDCFKEDIL